MIRERSFNSLELENVHRLMYGLHGSGGFATDQDIQRWHEQGFHFYSEPLMLHNNEFAYGLIQSKGSYYFLSLLEFIVCYINTLHYCEVQHTNHELRIYRTLSAYLKMMFGNLLIGGPCGILAVIQAEIFKDLFFFESEGSSSYNSSSISSSKLLPEQLLLRAVLRVLQRAAGSRSSIDFVVPTSANNVGGDSRNDSFHNSLSLTTSSNNLRVLSCDLTSLEDVTVFQVLETHLIGHLKSSIGCILFLMSLVLTRLG